MECSLQIQAVLYKNSFSSLRKSLDSIANALRVNRKTTSQKIITTVSYGDASPSPIISQQRIREINKDYADYFAFEYHFFNENTGFGKGHNLLGLSSNVDYLLIINPDIVLSPHFLESHLELFFDNSLNAGIVESRQTPVEHPKEYNLKTGETDWASGACMLIEQSTYKCLEGFDDETFFMYCEDVDLSWRVRMLGKKIIYQPIDPVFHPKQLNKNGRLIQTKTEMRFSAESNLLMAYKWSNQKQLKKLLSLYELSGEQHLKASAASFRKRQKNNQLPTPIDPQHLASTFKSTGEYSHHRFGL